MLKGKIKWYSKSKKFGFISCESHLNENIFFRIDSVKESVDEIDRGKTIIIPENGDMVEFIRYDYHGEIRAKKIKITQRAKEYFKCQKCGESVRPRILKEHVIKNNGRQLNDAEKNDRSLKSVCPNCFTVIKEFKTRNEIIIQYTKHSLLIFLFLISFLILILNR